MFDQVLKGNSSYSYANTTIKQIIVELDYLIAITYEVDKEHLIAIMSTFPKYFSSEDIEVIKQLEINLP